MEISDVSRSVAPIRATSPGGAPAETTLPAEPSCRLDLPRPEVTAPVEVAALLADHTRAGILKLLAGGPCSVCEIATALGERQNNVSNHLARLRESGLVHATHHHADARWVYYERDDASCAAALNTLRNLMEG